LVCLESDPSGWYLLPKATLLPEEVFGLSTFFVFGFLGCLEPDVEEDDGVLNQSLSSVGLIGYSFGVAFSQGYKVFYRSTQFNLSFPLAVGSRCKWRPSDRLIQKQYS
jgi:hypothetical protein